MTGQNLIRAGFAAVLLGWSIGVVLLWPEPPIEYEARWTTLPYSVAVHDGKLRLAQRMPLPLDPTCIDHFPRLPALAKRLGVRQAASIEPSAVIEMCDGARYDIFDIINAVLDRMEQVK